MKTCKECKWWKLETQLDAYASSISHGYCESMSMAGDNGQRQDGLDVVDCLGEWELSTGPDFGCIHFEEKQ